MRRIAYTYRVWPDEYLNFDASRQGLTDFNCFDTEQYLLVYWNWKSIMNRIRPVMISVDYDHWRSLLLIYNRARPIYKSKLWNKKQSLNYSLQGDNTGPGHLHDSWALKYFDEMPATSHSNSQAMPWQPERIMASCKNYPDKAWCSRLPGHSPGGEPYNT